MGVASPLQSGKPVEYWLGGLKTTELVQLWDFLSRNLDYESSLIFEGPNGPREMCGFRGATHQEVSKHLYSESLPSFFYACKDRGGLRPSERDKPALGVGLYKHRRTRDPLNK